MSFSKWMSDKLDRLINNATIKTHENAKKQIVICLLERKDTEAKVLFHKEFARYQDILKGTERNQHIIFEKLSEFNKWFQYNAICRK